MLDLRGRFAPLVTPFTDDGSGVSEIRLARLIRKLQDFGVSGFVVCTEAGEFTCLSFAERKYVLEVVLRECQGALPVLAHVSTLSTSSSLDIAQHAKRHGARAAILMPPYYPSYTQTEIEWHFKSVAQYSDIPVVVADPMNHISTALHETLSEITRLEFAGGEKRSDWFALDALKVEIAAGIPMQLSPPAAREFNEFGLKFGSAKVIKSALMEMDIEVGPLRKPLQTLEADARRAVEALLAG